MSRHPPQVHSLVRLRKRPLLLLEVMIAISLIVLAAIPLLYPHVFLVKVQRTYIERVELDHVVNLLFADIVEKMYKNEIPLNAILNKNVFDITDADLRRIQWDNRLPYKGSYVFEVYWHKPPGQEESPYNLYLVTLDFTFHPINQTPTEANRLKYHYDLFIVHDVGQGTLPPGETQQNQELQNESNPKNGSSRG